MARRKRDDDEDNDSGGAIGLSEDPKEKMRKAWFRALPSDIKGWDRDAAAAGMSTSAWLRALANTGPRLGQIAQICVPTAAAKEYARHCDKPVEEARIELTRLLIDATRAKSDSPLDSWAFSTEELEVHVGVSHQRRVAVIEEITVMEPRRRR